MRFRTPFDQAKEEDHHFEIPLTPKQRSILLDLLEHDKKPSIKDRHYLGKLLRDAPRKDGPPLPVASLDWRRAEREAKKRGESVVDYIWDQPMPSAA